MADHLRKYESLCVCPIRSAPARAAADLERARARRFTLTPQRMRMIVEAFRDTLELGLEKHGQVVVRARVARARRVRG
jgi:hypothetical protein